MKITVEQIKALNPCFNRFKNFTTHYPRFEGNLAEFLSLDNITHDDKMWVCTRLMSENQKFYFARAIARTTLHIFNRKNSNNSSVNDLLDYLDTIDNITIISKEQRTKIIELRRAAANAAYATVDAAAANATYAADASAYAATADAAVAVANAAYAAANAVANAADAYNARIEQEELNLIILNQIMELDI